MEHKNRIQQFMHCSKCIEELDTLQRESIVNVVAHEDEKYLSMSPREFAKVEVGFTKEGFQIWCKRHEENIADFDLMGNKIEVIQ